MAHHHHHYQTEASKRVPPRRRVSISVRAASRRLSSEFVGSAHSTTKSALFVATLSACGCARLFRDGAAEDNDDFYLCARFRISSRYDLGFFVVFSRLPN
uniref:Uncharacterized protein n=1 Tax=Caenorhabditis japonica TaxID=281687 RepID=A0A8R1EDP1_CAEJA